MLVDEHKHSPARMRYSNHFCTLRAERQADAAPMLWFTDSKTPRLLNSLHRGKRGSLGLEWLEGLLYQTPGTFSQHTLLEALIVRGGSASYFGEQQRDLLLLYLYQKLDENNSSNQQVHIAVQQYTIYSTRWYAVMWHQILYFLQNLVIPLRSSPTRRGAPRSDVWKAESPTKRLCLP